MRDDLGYEIDLPAPPQRIVSLVPSLTEAFAATEPSSLVGVTDWCTHPADLDVARVRGTKNPDLAAIAALEPDLVVVNKEENRALDVERLRSRGIRVWVTDIESVSESISSMKRLFSEALRWSIPDWLREVEEIWSRPAPPITGRLAVPIWRDPWMVVGAHTFTSDLLRLLGWENAFDHVEGRYPKVELAQIDQAGIDLVLLPDEPYVFTAEDGPEAFSTAPTQLVSGRALTWYGPAMLTARSELPSRTR